MTQFFVTAEILADRNYPERFGGLMKEAVEHGWEVSVTPAPYHLQDTSLPGGGCVFVLSFKPYKPIGPTMTVEDLLGLWGLP